MSEPFEEAVSEALDRLASVDPKTEEAVRASTRALPDRRVAARLPLPRVLSRRLAPVALGLAAIAVVAAVLIPAWRGNAAPGRPTSGTSAALVTAPASQIASLAASPTTPATTPPAFADPGGDVFAMRRLTAAFGWALVWQRGDGGTFGSKLMATDDAGVTWRDATPPGMLPGSPSIEFLDPDHGWVLQALPVDANNPKAPVPSALWRTTDGGRHWVKESLPVQAIFGAGIGFAGPNDGFLGLVPDGSPGSRRMLVYTTSNGGATWTKVGQMAGDQQFVGAGRLVALTRSDALLASPAAAHTHDGGRTWSPISLPRPAEIPAAAQLYVRDVVAAGADVFAAAQYYWKTGASYTYAEGYEFVSHDRGRTWSLAWSAAHGLDARATVVPVDASTLFRFPDYTATIPDAYGTSFAVTRDGGRTWTTADASLPADTHFDVESFGDPRNGWAVISRNAHCPAGISCPYSGGLPGQLVATSDGGKTWITGATK